MNSIPKEACKCMSELIAQWKAHKEMDINASCFCGGPLELSLCCREEQSFVTVFRRNALIGHGETYILRKKVELPKDFGKIFSMIQDVLYSERI